MVVLCTSEQLEKMLKYLDNQCLSFIRIFKAGEEFFIDYETSSRSMPLLNGNYNHYQAYQALKDLKKAFESQFIQDVEYQYTFDKGPHTLKFTYLTPISEEFSMSLTELLNQCLSTVGEEEIKLNELLYRPLGKKRSQSTHVKEVLEVLLKELENRV